MRLKITRWIVIAVLIGATLDSAAANSRPPSASASAWIAELGERVSAILRSPPSPARSAEVRGLLDDRFDMPAIAQFVAGGYWKTASDSDRAKFTAAFTSYMVGLLDLYSAKFAHYADRKLKVVSQTSGNAGASIVVSHFADADGADGTPIQWRVMERKDGFKVTDVIVGGVSLATTNRDEVTSLIRGNGGGIAAATAALASQGKKLSGR